jgi:plasmid stabilization system protein ParE
MTRTAVVLDGAKSDFLEIKKHVKRQFGDLVWADINQEFKDTIKQITVNPMLGTHVDGCLTRRASLASTGSKPVSTRIGR